MKRDMDLCRKILLAIEADPQQVSYLPEILPELKGEDQMRMFNHARLLGQAGLIEGGETSWALTWEGHEFVAASRDPGAWEYAKQKVQAVGSWTLPILTSILVEYAKKKLLGA